jgi:hypothetical protein
MGAVPLSRLLSLLSYMYLELEGILKQIDLKIVSKFMFELHEAATLPPLVHNPCIGRWLIHSRKLLQESSSETVRVQPEIAHEYVVVLLISLASAP